MLVDRSHKVGNGNGTNGAILFTDLARNAANVTLLARNGTVFNRAALYAILTRNGDHRDQVLGAKVCTSTAADALCIVYNGKTVNDMYCIGLGTCVAVL